MMKVLFIHQNFPGQFRHIAAHLTKQPETEVRAIGRVNAPGLAGVPVWRYKPHRQSSEHTHPYARTFEDGALHGQQVLRMLLKLSAKGYRPDIIIGHPGWGETLYVKQVYPDVPLIHFCEYYYHPHGADADFDPEFPLSRHSAAAIESRNAMHLLNLEHCDLGITPTQWQYSLHPKAYRHKLRVIHEGIDLENLGPNPNASLTLPNGKTLKAGDPVVTYVARNLEPYRGFHWFMRALPEVLKRHPTCQIVVVGGDGVSYGRSPDDAPNWRIKLLRENPMDTSRVHFLGKVDYATYRTVLKVSAVHVYLTYPFVLSWSLLEAMACGCHVIGSNTNPVREVIIDGCNGELVDPFKPEGIVAAVTRVLTQEYSEKNLRQQSRSTTVADYSHKAGISQYKSIIDRLVSKYRTDGIEVPAKSPVDTHQKETASC